MRPVLEHRLVDALRALQVLAPVLRNARVQDLVMASLDDVDRVDLHVTEVLDGGAHRPRAIAERRGLIEPLRAQPDAPGLEIAQGSLSGLWTVE